MIRRIWNRLFPWRLVRVHGCWRYFEHRGTGEREAWQTYGPGWSPLDREWLQGGKAHGLWQWED